MILKEYYNVSGVAQVYYKLKTGEDLTRDKAYRRWSMTRHPDKKFLTKALDLILKTAKEQVNQT